MEQFPDLEFGTPGALMLFMERFNSPRYIRIAEQSVLRNPKVHTFWMLNRVTNGAAKEDKGMYVDLFKSVWENSNYIPAVRTVAQHYFELQIES